MHSYSAYDDALGIKTVRWSPTGQLLAVGSFDQKLRVLNCLNWRCALEVELKQIDASRLVSVRCSNNEFAIDVLA